LEQQHQAAEERLVYIVSMRPEEPRPSLGRAITLRGFYDGLCLVGYRPVWLMIRQSRVKPLGIVRGLVRWLSALVRGQPLPLQSMLALQGDVESPPAGDARPGPGALIYIDGVRLASMLPRLEGPHRPRILVDFDDLMSRRIARMLRRREPISFGAFATLVPKPFRKLLDRLGFLHHWLYRVEKRLLRAAEVRAAATADALVFASNHEAALFGRLLRRYRPELSPEFLVLGPTVPRPDMSSAEIRLLPAPETIRFIFIGSDLLEQNRVAIEGILALAASGSLAASAHIYGRMHHRYDPVPGVTFHGFAETLEEVYQPGSILLIPRSVRGGIKTKILEAFHHGVPTIAVRSALEGWGARYCWGAESEDIAELTSNEAKLRDCYREASASGLELCLAHFSADRYWRVFRAYADRQQS
jgi:glycosyltransferase involved in cell wall biosynthesis